MKTVFKKVLLIALVITLAAGAYYYYHRGEVTTDNAAIDARTVTLSPKVAGYVKNLYIRDNQTVKAGDVLLEIDPTDYIIRRDRARSALQAAMAAAKASQSRLETDNVTAPASKDSVSAQLASWQAAWEKSSADRMRMESLRQAGAISQQQLDQAIAAEKSDRAMLEKFTADLRSANTAPSVIAASQNTSEQLQAQVKQAEADLAQAEADLANTRIIAPWDGRITKRSVEAGSYVQAGQQLGNIVGTELWVTANFKENQLEYMRPGQLAEIRIDAYPGVRLQGRVESLQAGTGSYFSLFPAENATGNFVKTVQRVPVKIVLESQPDASLPLGPGMSVVPTVYTSAGAGR